MSWNRWGLSLAILLAFFVVSLVYFAPAVLEGKDIFQPDVAGASGTAQDVRDYHQATGETSYWTNSLFGGMPMYQISPSYPSLGIMKGLQDLLTLQWPLNLLPSYSWLLFAMLVGFFIFMRSLAVGRLASALGAVMWTFSSYFVILIVAGHIWKLTVLAFIPPTIAGIIYIFRGQYLRGGIVTTFFAALQLMSNHVQMSYYFAFVILFLVIGYVVEAIRAGQWRHLGLSIGTTALSAILSIAINGSNLYHTYEYTQETMRGGSALSTSATGGGLDKEYITAWSYGKGETLTLLIPNVYGGATGYLGEDAKALEGVDPQLRNAVGQMNHYWGDQPFTAGPVYVGAFVLFLFILGLFVVRGPIKWALLAATILSVGLSWGHNMMWLTDLFIDHFPLYNKFRTVSSILVIAEFTIPVLAVLALVEFLRDPQRVVRMRAALWTSLSFTLGLSALIALVPNTFFSLLSSQEMEMFRPHLTNPEAQMILSALKEVRASIISADAWRSVLVIALSLALCYLYLRGTLRRTHVLLGLIAITLIDLWQVDKRYLSDKDFIDTSLIALQATPVSEVDKLIAQDQDLHYRVYNTSVSPFNDATTSYMHRSIGGYHAAKLARYQDLIEQQISKGNRGVLNMLDTRYIIGLTEDNKLTYARNDEALGAAWLIDLDRVKEVATPTEEMLTLGEIDLASQAVVMQDQGLALGATSDLPSDSLYKRTAEVQLIDYTPNRVKYEVDTDKPRLLVMSEIYYPHGWHLSIDGQPAEIKRANYVLRATPIPAGKHVVELHFDPKSVYTTEAIAWIAQGILALAVLWLLWRSYEDRTQKQAIDK